MQLVREAIGRGASAALSAAQHLRAGTRETARHYREGRALRERARQWSDADRRSWSLRQLQHVVRRAARETPFYRERFQAIGFDPERDFGFDDFASLPILEREEIGASTMAMQSSAVDASQRRVDGTGGSTGAPLQYWSGPEERGWRLSGQDHFMESLGVRRGSSIAFLWGHHIDLQERAHWREKVRDSVVNRRWFDCFRLSSDVLLEYHREMARFAPRTIVAYASALDAMAETLLTNGIQADYPSGRIITGAEKLWPAQRARIEAAFPVPVHERYGSRDVGFIAGQYDPREGGALTVDWMNLFIEPETDAPDAAIIVTKLHADAMPMIRYRLGDVARFPEGSRPGAPAFELPYVIGRQLDGLHLPDGRWIHGVGIPHLMKEQPLREFQIRQQEDYSIVVLVVPREGYTSSAGDEILRVLGANLPGVALRLEVVDAIERTGAQKWRPVVSLARAPRVPPEVTVQ